GSSTIVDDLDSGIDLAVVAGRIGAGRLARPPSVDDWPDSVVQPHLDHSAFADRAGGVGVGEMADSGDGVNFWSFSDSRRVWSRAECDPAHELGQPAEHFVHVPGD